MNVLILAAGYAKRLYPLTLNQPKPLLPVAGKPMIDHVLGCLSPIESIKHVYVVTNAKFVEHFEQWAARFRATSPALKITVVNDGTTTEENRRGAIGDLKFVLDQEKLDDDLMVVAGDNLFNRSLEPFGRFCREKNQPVLGIYDVGSLEAARKYGVVAIDAQGVLTDFVEKPEHPPSSLIGIALYFYPRATLPLIRQYIAEGNNPDQPGRLIQWLYKRQPVFTWPLPGIWFDIGSKETLEEANRVFGG